MSQYITHLEVSTSPTEEEENKNNGFTKVPVNLNTGVKAKEVFLWYRKSAEFRPITRVQVTYNQPMANGLTMAKYMKINHNMNAGTGGDALFMWYSRVSEAHDVPIVDIAVTTDAQEEAAMLGKDGVWEKVSCDLNRKAGGNWVYAWLKREKPVFIKEVTATNTYDKDSLLYSDGFTRVDVDTNTGAGGSDIFIWYRKTTNASDSLSNLNISINSDQERALQSLGYKKVDLNLNEGTQNGNTVYLWFKKGNSNKIKAINLLIRKAAVEIYDMANIKVIERDLNAGNSGTAIYLCYN